ncbi:MAG: Cys-tRNA(Pro) deacylase [Acidimicrobiaceae bacterium]|nr:Cys-tRNA(Pro) deacylase [Acidimicrobiaceae bacterium]
MAKGATPAIVMLEAAGVAFAVTEFHHEPGERNYGQVAAEALGIDPDRVFKTLVANLATDAGIEQVVGIVPVSGQLSLRELAAALGGKRAEMCPVDLAQRLTGYVVGGISPFGQKKRLRTAIDETCILFDTVFVSGGKRGLDIEIAPDALVAVLGAVVAPIGSDRLTTEPAQCARYLRSSESTRRAATTNATADNPTSTAT